MSEQLHEDLVPYLSEMSNGWKILQHPLVYAVPFFGDDFQTKQVNAMYAYKREAIIKAKRECAYPRMVAMYERPYRIEVVKQYGDDMEPAQYWEVVRDVWTDSENIYQNIDTWREILEPAVGIDPFNTLSELPDTITVYRGGTPDGFSWTRKRDTAEWFARRFRDEGNYLPVWEIQIPKSKAIAYLIDRGEEEVVWIPQDDELQRMIEHSI